MVNQHLLDAIADLGSKLQTKVLCERHRWYHIWRIEVVIITNLGQKQKSA